MGLAQKHLATEDAYAGLKAAGAAAAALRFAPPAMEKALALQHMSHAFEGATATGFMIVGLAMGRGIGRIMKPALEYRREKRFSDWLRKEGLTRERLQHLGDANDSDELDVLAERFIDGLVKQGRSMHCGGVYYTDREIYRFIGDNSRDNPHDVLDNELRTALRELKKGGASPRELVGVGRAALIAEERYELSVSSDLMKKRNLGKEIIIKMPDEHDRTEPVEKRGILEDVYRNEERLVVMLRTGRGAGGGRHYAWRVPRGCH